MERFFTTKKINIILISICLIVSLGLILSVCKYNTPKTLEIVLDTQIQGIGVTLAPRIASYLANNYFMIDKLAFLILFVLNIVSFGLLLMRNIHLNDILSKGFNENRELHHGTRYYVNGIISKGDKNWEE